VSAFYDDYDTAVCTGVLLVAMFFDLQMICLYGTG
jgi:hypothetical protein